jgi:hypothetical protein
LVVTMKHSKIGGHAFTIIALCWSANAGAQEEPKLPAAAPKAEKPAEEKKAPAPAAQPAKAPEATPAQPKTPAAAAAPQAEAKPEEKPATEAAEPAPAQAAAASAPPEVQATPEEEPKKDEVWVAPTPENQPTEPMLEEQPAAGEELPAVPLLGLGVGVPDIQAPAGNFTPSYSAPVSPGDWRFDFHAYLAVPFRVGINSRENPYETQYRTVYHAPPLVPDEYERFEHTGVMPQPWVQMNFSYGNSDVVGTIIIAAKTVQNGSGYFNPPDHIGINDAFVTFKPDLGMNLEIDVGGFANRYGAMGEYDLGRYDTPVIARVGGVGETARARVPVAGDLWFLAEHGVMGQFDRAQLGVESAGWNDFADSNVGSSFAHHAHLGLAQEGLGQLGLHYVHAFTRDDRVAPTLADGGITVLGADVSAEFQRFGRAYLGMGYTDASDARTVSPIIRVLNAPGGPGLMREYLGPDSGGNGSLFTLGGQYDLSIGQLARHPVPFSGYGPDIVVSLFGIYTSVSSDDSAYDGVSKMKYGTEVTYSALPWLAFGGRYDRVVADTDDDTKTFAVISPRLILRTDYNAQDQVTLQYSRWLYGSGVAIRDGYPPRDDLSVRPDENTVSMNVNMWW